MELYPRLRKEIQVSGDPEQISNKIVMGMPDHNIAVTRHLPGIDIKAQMPGLLSPEAHLSFHLAGDHQIGVTIESRSGSPWDVTHGNEKTLAMLEELVIAASRGGATSQADARTA